jgi:hypothetical protein
MAQLNKKKSKMPCSIKVEKSFETFTTNYSHKYTPTVICDCGKPCKYRNEDRTFKIADSSALSNLTSSPMLFKKYQTKKLIKDDKIDLKKDIFNKYRDNNLNLNESIANNNNNKSGSESVNLLDDSNGAYSNSNYTQDMISNLAYFIIYITIIF